MIEKIKNNRIYFNINDKAFANISLFEKKSYAYFELLKVKKSCRNSGYASKLLEEVLKYIKKKKCKKVELNPLPLDLNGLKLEQLISFYKRHGFELSKKDKNLPYLMYKYLI